MTRPRLRDLGCRIGRFQPGRYNAITDVPGVLVGHSQVLRDTPYIVRSGVTVVLPEHGDIWTRHLFAGSHVLNGNGEVTGLAFLNEFGRLASPIAITATGSVGPVHEGLVMAEAERDTGADFCLPVVAETYDGWLSDTRARAVRPEHLREALAAAASGPVAEGSVGGGTGMITHEFKAGIGTSSRRVEIADNTWTLGALVQSNYGVRHRLSLDGQPIGRLIPTDEVPAPWPRSSDSGSIIGVVATNAPLLPVQCRRLAQRLALAVGRVGGVGAPSSGDLFIAFSSATALTNGDGATLHTARFLDDFALAPLYEAVVDAGEESIWNALCAAQTMHGRDEHVCHAIPIDRLAAVIRARDTLR